MTKVKVTTKCFETDQIVQQLKTGAFLEYYHSSLGITSQKATQLSVCLKCRDHFVPPHKKRHCFSSNRRISLRFPSPVSRYFLTLYTLLIADFGPLKTLWCMRFEGKHQYFKRTLATSEACVTPSDDEKRHHVMMMMMYSSLFITVLIYKGIFS